MILIIDGLVSPFSAILSKWCKTSDKTRMEVTPESNPSHGCCKIYIKCITILSKIVRICQITARI